MEASRNRGGKASDRRAGARRNLTERRNPTSVVVRTRIKWKARESSERRERKKM